MLGVRKGDGGNEEKQGPLFPRWRVLKHYLCNRSHFPLHLPKLASGTSQSIGSWPKPYHVSRPQANRKCAPTVVRGLALSGTSP